MTGAHVVVLAVVASTALFAAWVWGMNRLDERRQRQMADELRRPELPIPGGRHRRRPPR